MHVTECVAAAFMRKLPGVQTHIVESKIWPPCAPGMPIMCSHTG